MVDLQFHKEYKKYDKNRGFHLKIQSKREFLLQPQVSNV